MCTTCGCGEGETRIEGQHVHHHEHAHHHEHGHDHDGHHHGHGHDDTNHHAHEAAAGVTALHAHADASDAGRLIRLERDILAKNDRFAQENRRWLGQHGILALNLVSSPGSGKTTLLVRSAVDLHAEMPVAVLEGDQETSLDAERIRATGVPALQINTGKGCHLDAHMVGHAMQGLDVADESVLFIENVGNLVCPAAFDLGEAAKVAILSVTEGDDKPLKYPDMFHAARLMLLNKIDLLPHVDYNVDKCIEYARRVNPEIQVLQLSARTGAGLDAWYEWIRLTRRTRLLGRVRPAAAASSATAAVPSA